MRDRFAATLDEAAAEEYEARLQPGGAEALAAVRLEIENSADGADRGLRAASATSRRRRSSSAAARSTGSASRASTRAPASPRCSGTSETAAGCSRPTAAARTLPPLPPRDAGPRDDLGDGRAASSASSTSCRRAARAPDIVRIVEGVRGPRADALRARPSASTTASIVPWVRRIDDTRLAIAGPDALCFRTPAADARREHDDTVSEFEVGEGERVPFVLTWFPSHEPSCRRRSTRSRRSPTPRRFWREWTRAAAPWRCPTSGRGRAPLADRSSRRSPTRRPAASSPRRRRRCPEWIGGVRNWDYRYCWLRDATLTLLALLNAGYADEAAAWRDWLLRAVAGDPADLQIMYGVAGERRLTELELPWLAGYEGSRAGADRQRGERAAPARRLRRGRWTRSTRRGRTASRPSPPAWELQTTLLEFLEDAWRRARRGDLGDPRRAPALHALEGDGVGRVRPRRAHRRGAAAWTARPTAGARSATRSTREVCERGFDAELGSFTQSYGSTAARREPAPDPAGRLPARLRSARARARSRRSSGSCSHDGFVLALPHRGGRRRPPARRGRLPAVLVLARRRYALLGRHEDAHALLRAARSGSRTTSACSPRSTTPRPGRLLGNFPQAFTHLALVNSAFNVAPHLPAPIRRRHTE